MKAKRHTAVLTVHKNLGPFLRVIPAEAGIQFRKASLGSRLRGSDELLGSFIWPVRTVKHARE